jgi:ankyrin repeat protein
MSMNFNQESHILNDGKIICLQTQMMKTIVLADIHHLNKLLELKANVNEANCQGITPLMLASSTRHDQTVNMVNLLCAHGADVHQKSLFGHSAMDYANGTCTFGN